MTLDYAILGFLTFEPLSGYDLKTQYFDGSVGNFYPANQRQIYRTLERLESEGWVEAEMIIQEGRPNRREYSITEAGRNALKRWLHESPPLKTIVVPFLVQVYFAKEITDDEIIAVLEDQLRQHREQLAIYHDIDLPPLDESQHAA